MKQRYLETGKIVSTHGIAGEVKILPWADDPADLLDFDTLYIDGQPYEVRGGRVHKGCVLVRFAGIDDVNAAMRLLPCRHLRAGGARRRHRGRPGDHRGRPDAPRQQRLRRPRR